MYYIVLLLVFIYIILCKYCARGQGLLHFINEISILIKKYIIFLTNINLLFVCSLMTISQKLQEIVISQNVLEKRESKTLEFIVSPNHLNILRDAITQVAIEIHNVYVLKSLGNQSLDPFRL